MSEVDQGVTALVEDALAGKRRELDVLHRVVIGSDATYPRDDAIDALARCAQADGRSAEMPHAMDLLLALVISGQLAERPIRSVLFDDADVADATQQTLVKIYEKLPLWHGEAPFRLWLRTVARNEALSLLRSKTRLAVPNDPTNGVEAPGTFVRRMSSLIADASAVTSAVEALPEEYRVTLMLREYEQLSYEQIAARLGIALGTAKSRVNRARLMVAERLRSQAAP